MPAYQQVPRALRSGYSCRTKNLALEIVRRKMRTVLDEPCILATTVIRVEAVQRLRSDTPSHWDREYRRRIVFYIERSVHPTSWIHSESPHCSRNRREGDLADRKCVLFANNRSACLLESHCPRCSYEHSCLKTLLQKHWHAE